jgi:hypothetical protein
LLKKWIYLTVLLIDRYAMPGAGENPQGDGATAGLELLGKQFSLPNRNALILRPVQHKDGRPDLVDMIDRRTSPECLSRGPGLEPNIGVDAR